MSEPINLNTRTLNELDFILNITDLSAGSEDLPAFSREDLIEIAVHMYFLAVMTEHMESPAVEIWCMALKRWQLLKEADDAS